MSQYIPNTAMASAPKTNASGSEAQPGRPEERSANAARRATCGRRPLRCRLMTQNIAAVITSAPTDAAMVCPIAAPAAGAALAITIVTLKTRDELPRKRKTQTAQISRTRPPQRHVGHDHFRQTASVAARRGLRVRRLAVRAAARRGHTGGSRTHRL